MNPWAAYPSRVFRALTPGLQGAELYVKDDGRVRADFGGNKVRKLEGVLPALVARGVTRVVTVGPAGSHHVLATALLGRQLGVKTRAVLFPEPWSAHAEGVLRASLAQGIDAIPVASRAEAAWELVRARAKGEAVIPPGASSPRGAAGYACAVAELKSQIQSGELPEPDVIVVALGSGGTAAGLLAGTVMEGLDTAVVGVDIGAAGRLAEPLTLGIAAALAGPRKLGELRKRLVLERAYQGRGYGFALAGYERTAAIGAELGLSMDPTYTGKALAAALEWAKDPARVLNVRRALDVAGQGRPLRVLYWHTLSWVLPETNPHSPLPRELDQLFVHE